MSLPRLNAVASQAAENFHHQRAERLRFRITRDGRLMAGTTHMDRAVSLLAVLSRDGELDGWRIETRGGGR